MARIVSATWQKEMIRKMDAHERIDESIGFLRAAQWLIEVLSSRNIPFAVYNLGGGVKRVTTETDKCPCCKKAI